jgi:hypothetical protein
MRQVTAISRRMTRSMTRKRPSEPSRGLECVSLGDGVRVEETGATRTGTGMVGVVIGDGLFGGML